MAWGLGFQGGELGFRVSGISVLGLRLLGLSVLGIRF